MTPNTSSAPGASASPRRQQQRLLFAGIAVLTLLGLGLLLAARLLTNSFASIEAEAVERKASQIQQAFSTDLRQLAISNRDYAEWDSTVDYLASGDRAYINANFTAETLGTMHVDLVWILDRSGRELYSALYNQDSGTVISPAPAALLSKFRRVMPLTASMGAREPAERLLRTAGGLAAFSVLEIKRTDRSAATGAQLLFARFIDAGQLASVQATLDLPLSYAYLPAQLTTASAGDVPDPVRHWIADPAGRDKFVWHDGDASVTGYLLVRDIDGTPVAVFSTTGPRTIYALGHRMTSLLLGGIAVAILLGSACVMWLVLRLRRAFAIHEATEHRYASIAGQLHESITLALPDTGQIVEANAAVLATLGCSGGAIRSRTVLDLYPDLTTSLLEDARRSDAPHTVLESRMRRAGGGTIDAEISITRMEDRGRTLLCLVGHDVSHRKQAEQQQRASNRRLVHMAQHDSLTGLPNRLYLRARLPRALRHAAVADKLMALIYLDIDHFKNINDSRGHGVGDQLLQVVAKRLRAAVAAQDVVVRMGGDEFVIVAALLPNVAAVESLAQRLQAAVQAQLSIDDNALEVSASMGIAIHPDDGLDMEALLKHADIALYQAKASGRRCHRLFSQDMVVRVSENVALEQALRRGVGTSQFSMEYQPIIDLRTGRVASLEALMRWRHPELGIIPPSQFIPVADASGLTVEIGMQALREVLGQLRTWLDAEVPVVPIAVNISPVQLEKPDFCDSVLRLASEFKVDPRWLRFEITETALLKDPETLVGTLQALRTLGSEVLIDDFGTGYSGLSYLARLPVDSLKIDRSFISDIGRSTTRAPIIGAVIDMARKLHMKTIAEGIETVAQANMLRDAGCDYGQGYYFSKPVTARHCKALLEQLGWEKPLTETLIVRALKSS